MGRDCRRREGEELCGGLSAYHDALGLAQPGRGEEVVDRRFGPGKRMVRPPYDLARADFGDQVAQPLGGEDHRIVL